MRTVLKGSVGWRTNRVLVLVLVMAGGILLTQACSGDGGSAETDRAAMVALNHSTNGLLAKIVLSNLSREQRDTFFQDGDTLIEKWETFLENIDVITKQWNDSWAYTFGDGFIETDGEGRITLLKIGGESFGYVFVGEIPPELGNLGKLEELRLHGGLTEIPPELGNLGKLEELDLKGVFTGEIPPELGNLSRLRVLRLDGRFTGEIPLELGNLSRLEALDLRYNGLTGEIPKELGTLGNLRELKLNFNQLTGEIPSEIGNLRSLEILWLNNNALTGQIPSELGDMDNLVYLSLKDNQLTGCIPQALRSVARRDTYRLNLPFCEAP